MGELVIKDMDGRELSEEPGRPLQSQRFAAAVDTLERALQGAPGARFGGGPPEGAGAGLVRLRGPPLEGAPERTGRRWSAVGCGGAAGVRSRGPPLQGAAERTVRRWTARAYAGVGGGLTALRRRILPTALHRAPTGR